MRLARPGLAVTLVAAVFSAPFAAAAPSAGTGASGLSGPPLLHAASPDAPQLENRAPFRAAPLLVSGTDAFRGGEYVYQDYLFDDHGADTTPGPGASQALFAPTAGDVQYPAAKRYLNNAADLVELRIRPTPRTIDYRITLNTVTARDAAVVGIGIDMDRTGGAAVPWPLGAGVSTPGLDAFITAWGTSGVVTDVRTGRSKALPPGSVQMDMRRRQMTVSVSRTQLDPGTATWRYVAGTGLWDGRGWMQVATGDAQRPDRPVSGSRALGAPAVFNLAFRFAEPIGALEHVPVGAPPARTAPGRGNWFEDQQASDLATATSGAAGADVDFGRLARGSSGWAHPPGRLQARLFPSSLRTAQGVVPFAQLFSGDVPFPQFGGQLQPYLVHLPPSYRPGRVAPMTFALHPSLATYTVYAVYDPRYYAQVGDARDNVVVTPLGRGVEHPGAHGLGAYHEQGEADFFEVWSDVRRHFSIDEKRVTLSGVSLGGEGAYHLAVHYPDLFAAVFSIVGKPPPDRCDNGPLLANLRSVPLLAWNYADDRIVPYEEVRAAHEALQAFGVPHEQWTFPAGGHLDPNIRDSWLGALPYLTNRAVVTNPASIEYAMCPETDRPQWGLLRNRAYWLSALTAVPGANAARIAAQSAALPERQSPEPITTVRDNGEAYAAAVEGLEAAPARSRTARNELRLQLDHLSSATVDGARAGLTAGQRLQIIVHSTNAVDVTIRLRGLGKRSSWGRATATATGPDHVRLHIPAGDSVITFS